MTLHPFKRARLSSPLLSSPLLSSPLLFLIVALLAMVWPLAILAYIAEGFTDRLPHMLWTIPFNALFIALPYLWVKPKWRWAILIPVWGVAIFALCNLWYFFYYCDFIPFSSWFAYNNLDPILFNSVLLVAKPGHFMLLAGAVIATLSYALWFRKRIKVGRYSRRAKFIATAIAVVPIFIGECAFIHKKSNKLHIPISKGISNYVLNAPGSFNVLGEYSHGIVPFFGRQIWYRFIVKPLKSTELTEDKVAQVKDWWRRHDSLVCSNDSLRPIFANNRDKNLILIVVESLNAFAVHAEVNGQKVMPCLSSLANDSTVISCLNMRSQIKSGVSSDGQLMFNTGLYPTTDGIVALDYTDNKFISLAKELGGYSTEVICEKPALWNHDKTNKAYEFDGLITDTNSLSRERALSRDMVLMQEVGALMDTLTTKPNFIFATTMCMHTPYEEAFSPMPAFIAKSNVEEQLKKYYHVCNVFDQALSYFLQRLQASGHYQNSVIAIASDHAGDIGNHGQEQPIVFMVLNSGYGKQIAEPINQVDVYPTLLEIMARNTNSRYTGMGFSIFNPNRESFRAKRDSLQQEATEVSNLMMSGNWFKGGEKRRSGAHKG